MGPMEEDICPHVREVLERLVAAAASSAKDWSSYQWQQDCQSAPSYSTSADIKDSDSCAWSSSSDGSSSECSDAEVACGKAAAKFPGRWKKVKKRPTVVKETVVASENPVVESKPAEWPSAEWTIALKDPLLVGKTAFEFKDSECYLKGVKWAPDGSCWLASANDNNIRVYNLPELYCRSEMAMSTAAEEFKPVIKANEGDSIYDYCWFPFMDSSQAHTCYFFTASKDHPVHLRDAFTGQLAASYTARNQVDVLIAPFAIHCCRVDGRKLYAGYNRQIRIFDLERPGPISLLTKPTVERSIGGQGQTGLISCFAQEPTGGSLIAVGCYDKSIGLYSTQEMMQFSVMTAHRAGVTHLAFGHNGNYLYSGARKDGDILCWDVRRPGRVVAAYRRVVTTNQRIYFDITPNGKYLISGGSDGQVSFFDLTTPVCSTSSGGSTNGVPVVEPAFTFNPHTDCVNGVSFHPSLPLILTSSGQRWFDMKRLIVSSGEESDSSSSDKEPEYSIPRTANYKTSLNPENSMKLWQFDAIAL